MKIGIVSDTHGLFRPEIAPTLDGVERILHLGDVGKPAVLAELAKIAPVTAVRGNVDREGPCAELPETDVVLIADRYVYMLHDLHTLHLDPAAGKFAAVLSGHTHVGSQRGFWRCGGLSIHFHHREAAAFVGYGFAIFGDVAEAHEQEAGQGLHAAVAGQAPLHLGFQVAQVHAAVHQQRAAGGGQDGQAGESNSSSSSPVSCSMASSAVTRPTVEPYSSTTMAIWRRRCWKSRIRSRTDLGFRTQTHDVAHHLGKLEFDHRSGRRKNMSRARSLE
jgi:hypothetical protein